jgi:hypothetical protein
MGEFVLNIVIGIVLWVVFRSIFPKSSSTYRGTNKSSDKPFYDSKGDFVGINGTHSMNGTKLR